MRDLLTIPSAVRNFHDDISPDSLVSINASVISPELILSFAKSCHIRLKILWMHRRTRESVSDGREGEERNALPRWVFLSIRVRKRNRIRLEKPHRTAIVAMTDMLFRKFDRSAASDRKSPTMT